MITFYYKELCKLLLQIKKEWQRKYYLFFLNLFVCLFYYLACACVSPRIFILLTTIVRHICNFDAVYMLFSIVVAKSLTVSQLFQRRLNWTTYDCNQQMCLSVYERVRALFALKSPRGNKIPRQFHTFVLSTSQNFWSYFSNYHWSISHRLLALWKYHENFNP